MYETLSIDISKGTAHPSGGLGDVQQGRNGVVNSRHVHNASGMCSACRPAG